IYTRLALYDREKFFTPLKNVIRHCLNLEIGDAEGIKKTLLKSLSENDKNYLPLFNDLFKLDIEENSFTMSLTNKERKEIFFAIVSRILLPPLSEKPHYIFIDNIDFADPSSVEFLIFISQDLSETKSKIIFTLREENIEFFKDLLEKSHKIKLPPLSKLDVESYLVQREGFATPPEFLLDFLFQKSGGNPKFLSELVSIMKTQNLAFIGASGKYEVDEDKLTTTTFPDTLQGLFLSKVESLSESDRFFLRAASVLGTSFSIDTLSSLVEREQGILVSKIKELEKTGLIKMDTWGARLYASFSDNLLREAVYNSLNFELRRELHLKVACFLENEGIGSPRVLPVLARHYENGGDTQKALHYLFESAKYSKSIYDYRSSYEYLSRYVLLAEKSNFSLGKDSQFLEAFVMYAEVQQELGRIKEAGICFEKIINEIEELSSIKIKSLSKLADNKRREGNLKESLELYEKALEGAKQLKDESLQCIIFLYYGVPLAMSGKMGKAMDYFQRAEILAEKTKDYPSLVYALMNRGLVEYFRGKLEGAKSFLLKAKEIASENNLRSYLALITVNLAQVFFESGDYPKALDICKEAEEVSRQFGYRNHLVMSMTNRALFETMLGLWDEADKSVEKALSAAQHYNMAYLCATNFHIKSLLYFTNGYLSKSFKHQILAFENYLNNSHFGEAVGSLSEILSITNQFGISDFAVKILDENLGKLQKELENSSRTWTISFNTHYSFHKFLLEELDYYDAEEKLDDLLEKARETGILWLVADVGSVVLRFYHSNNKYEKAAEIGEDLFPLLSTHYCPLILPKFLIAFCKSLIFEKKSDELSSALACLCQYEKFLDRGLMGMEYNYLLCKVLENDKIGEAKKRLLFAKDIATKIEDNEEDDTFKNAFLNLQIVKEVRESSSD
ncbi:MAG: tetratricopeptide repeat protein, partial [Acidobacteria bacterium]|nr:tetratricopeptide repeat protein [Acidobacteriota bacterium]